jgi:hypothetical protein
MQEVDNVTETYISIILIFLFKDLINAIRKTNDESYLSEFLSLREDVTTIIIMI